MQPRRRLRVFKVAHEFPVLLQPDVASSYLRNDGRAVLEQGVSMWEMLRRMQRSRSVVSLTLPPIPVLVRRGGVPGWVPGAG